MTGSFGEMVGPDKNVTSPASCKHNNDQNCYQTKGLVTSATENLPVRDWGTGCYFQHWFKNKLSVYDHDDR